MSELPQATLDVPAAGAFRLLVAAVGQDFDPQTTEFDSGRVAMSKFGRKRRVVFLQLTGRLSSPTRKPYKPPSEPGTIITPVYDVVSDVVARISAESEAARDQLWLEVLLSCRKVLGFSSQPGPFRIDSEDESVGVSSNELPMLTQRFTWTFTLGFKRPTASVGVQTLVYGLEGWSP